MKKVFNISMLGCLALGIMGGLLIPEVIINFEFIGTIYINLLKFMIIPLIFSITTVTIYNSKKEKKKDFLKAIVIFIVMFIITFGLTSVIVYFVNTKELVISSPDWVGTTTNLSIGQIFINLFPDNMITMIQNNNIFACIIVASVFALAAKKTEKGETIIAVVDSLKSVLFKMLDWIMLLTPIAVFSLIGSTIANYGSLVIGVGATYVGIAYLCSIIALFGTMILPVWLYAKINPLVYIKKLWKLWALTITTCSSLATLPYTLEICKKEFKISRKTANLLVPFGCTIHKCGGAVSFALLAVFCSKIFGIPVTLETYLIMVLGALFINMAAPGIPSGGIILGATYLSALNIPLVFIGLYGGIYRLLDMAYTTLNVTGNISANILIDTKLKKHS